MNYTVRRLLILPRFTGNDPLSLSQNKQNNMIKALEQHYCHIFRVHSLERDFMKEQT